MDDKFLDELDAHISNIGIDEVWKRKIGKHLIWFSPLTTTAQAKVNETLANEDLGVNAILETKRVTISNVIVGIDDFDLTEYREAGSVFVIRGKKKGEKVKVTLDRYIYEKIKNWGNDWFDLAFQVFADLMETFGENNKKDVKFDNIKDPREELAELELRVSSIRRELGIPQLIEGPETELTEKEIQEVTEEARKVTRGERTSMDDFDPFKAIPDTTEDQEESIPTPAPAPAPAPAPVPALEPVPKPVKYQPAQPVQAPINPEAVISIPTPDPSKLSPIQQAMANRAQRAQAQMMINARESSPERPIDPSPSITKEEVIDKPMDKSTAPVKVDKPRQQSKNPRFKKPNR